MPQAPNVDGLPDWLKIVITIAFGMVTIWMALRGYGNGPKETNSGSSHTTVAHLADMGAVRHLADVCHNLTAHVIGLERQIGELTHHVRSQIELDRETCQRLRELREAIDRQSPG